jgi:hypothetical protein
MKASILAVELTSQIGTSPVVAGMRLPSSLSDLGYSLVVARVRAFFTEAQNHEERAKTCATTS